MHAQQSERQQAEMLAIGVFGDEGTIPSRSSLAKASLPHAFKDLNAWLSQFDLPPLGSTMDL